MRGKKVIIGTASEGLGDQYFVPGTGKLGGVYVHVIAAETLQSSKPFYAGWMPLYAVALAAAFVAVRQRRPIKQAALIVPTALAALVAPAALEAHNIVIDVLPALLVLATVGGILVWRQFRSRGLLNDTSGLPNLNALRKSRDGRKSAIVAARILNFEEIVATLAPNQERQLIEQIVARLNVGSPQRMLYHGDAGIFAWFEDAPTVRQSSGSAVFVVPEPRPCRRNVDRPPGGLRGRGGQRPVSRQPPGKRARCR